TPRLIARGALRGTLRCAACREGMKVIPTQKANRECAHHAQRQYLAGPRLQRPRAMQCASAPLPRDALGLIRCFLGTVPCLYPADIGLCVRRIDCAGIAIKAFP